MYILYLLTHFPTNYTPTQFIVVKNKQTSKTEWKLNVYYQSDVKAFLMIT